MRKPAQYRMAMNEIAESNFNSRLAAACQNCAASCCKKGLLFLPAHEHARISDWLHANGRSELSEFLSRAKPHEGFFLYDQQERCQFLDEQNLCRLHPIGIKPTECFWWPFHVYSEGEALAIRLSTSCCDGYKEFRAGLPFLDIIEEQAKQIGLTLIRAFRKVYSGSYNTTFVKELDG